MRAKKAPSRQTSKKRASKKSAAKKAPTKRAAKKTPVRNTVTKRAVKRPKKRVRRSRFSFANFKQSVNSKAAKVIVALSFVSVAFPSLYEWGSNQVNSAVAVAQPVIATYAEDAVKQAVSASPLAKTAAGIWIIDRVGQWASSSSYERRASGGAGLPASTSGKVDLVVNPFY